MARPVDPEDRGFVCLGTKSRSPALADDGFNFRKDFLEVNGRKVRGYSNPYPESFVREDGLKLIMRRFELAPG